VVTTRTRNYGAAAVIMGLATIIAAILVLDIALVYLGANGDNDIVHFFMQLGSFFATPFKHMFSEPTEKREILVNWGIAAIGYMIIGAILARLFRRFA
jgi:hypothetical protein